MTIKKENTLELSLFDNSLDSLNESIVKLCISPQEKGTSLKFAILHLYHFIELFLKYYVSQQHELLIFTDPKKQRFSAQNKEGNAKTITSDEAICILENCNINIGAALKSDIKELRDYRNQIMHYKINIKKEIVENLLSKIIYDLSKFDTSHLNSGIEDRISAEHKDKISQLIQDVQKRREMALNAAETLRKNDGYDQEIDLCPSCGYKTLKILEKENSVQCIFCNFQNHYIECSSCLKIYPNNDSFSIDYKNCNTCDLCCHKSDYGEYMYDTMKDSRG